jgi:16S rRNA (cytosine1402-N4)-methyltransferase
MYHDPVLLIESVDGLNIKPGGTYVDVTYGGGGHSKAILDKIGNGKLIAFDQDEDALANTIEDSRLILLNHNFKYLKNFLRLHNAIPADGILADLGVSSHQINIPERGFSVRFEGKLDLRMDRKSPLTAREVINDYEESKLGEVLALYGELPHSYRMAATIVKARKNNVVETTEQLKEIMMPFADKRKENKFFAKVFQALRIEVNHELDALKELLLQGTQALAPGGRMVVISYHSLEDRLVKNYFRSGNFAGQIEKDFYGNPLVPYKLITRKAMVPGDEEIERNNRARSAKLRIAEKI